jgi:hypothetical protein
LFLAYKSTLHSVFSTCFFFHTFLLLGIFISLTYFENLNSLDLCP